MSLPDCRFCQKPLKNVFVDLGMTPLSNSYLSSEMLYQMEPYYPLKAFVCDNCYLVQLQEFETPEQIFRDYSYFSSYSKSWLEHSKKYADESVKRHSLNKNNLVMELACNDGYLLQYFQKHGIPVLGIEPAKNVAIEAEKIGIPVITEFFGTKLAWSLTEQGKKPDLLVANNVLAHVPDLNDFVRGIKIILNTNGTATFEFPHIYRLLEHKQFDTIYHEHFSYFSFLTVTEVFKRHGLMVYDVDELQTHGGSIRVYVTHQESPKPITQKVTELIQREKNEGFGTLEKYLSFQRSADIIRWNTLSFLIDAANKGKKVLGYGAPAKCNTFFNFCGIRRDLVPFTTDISPHKQGLYLPGSHIPIHSPEVILSEKPDYLFILPWNIKDEIISQMSAIRQWGGKFVIAIPELKIID
ncbi:MAG: class I SAM-dependent methyltransferase [Candidatus Riflebacteria bacterium]|nr:class I SAM-dependent methyltransferase [Candidatus Riflebacteria bacterium]